MFDALAGLARVRHVQGNHLAALDYVEPLLQHGDGDSSFDGCIFARLLELTCYRVLLAAHDASHARFWLTKARDAVRTTADRISDGTLREGFLTNIPEHVEILSAWSTQFGGTAQ